MSERLLTQGLDYYKPTMSQLEYTHYPNAEVTFTMNNRSEDLLSQHVSAEELQEHLDALQARSWQHEEIDYLAGLTAQDGGPRFGEAYLHYISSHPLPNVSVGYDHRNDLAVETTGAWPLVTFWETVVMSELNELYFKNKLASDDISLDDIYREGDKRLSDKIALLTERPDIKFSDFGTRRRFSYDWHKHVIERLASECPDNFIGTSNVYLAKELGLPPIGTFAHELPMGYAALADSKGENPLDGHREMLRDWQRLYRGELSTALTDTFTSGFFFADFSAEQADSWQALRHDSGDPIEFGEMAIDFYRRQGIDPTTKTVVFSDGLDIDSIVGLADHFKGRIGSLYGWGTTLTNDLGLKPNNFVMKATSLNGTGTVKLSDVRTKHTGEQSNVERYSTLVNQRVGSKALVGSGV